MVVAREYQKKGLGQKLVDYAVNTKSKNVIKLFYIVITLKQHFIKNLVLVINQLRMVKYL